MAVDCRNLERDPVAIESIEVCPLWSCRGTLEW